MKMWNPPKSVPVTLGWERCKVPSCRVCSIFNPWAGRILGSAMGLEVFDEVYIVTMQVQACIWASRWFWKTGIYNRSKIHRSAQLWVILHVHNY